MDTAHMFSMFVVTVWTLINGYQISRTNCELHFVGMSDPDDVITVENGKELSVTFYRNCQKSSSTYVVRVTRHEQIYVHNICRIIFDGQTCYVTNSSLHCRCVNETFAEFHKIATPSDDGKYQWSIIGNPSEERTITFRILPTFTTTDEPANRGKVVLVVSMSFLSFGFLVAVIIFVHWIVRRKRGHGGQGAEVSDTPHYVNFTNGVDLDSCQYVLGENDYDDVMPGTSQNLYTAGHRPCTEVLLPYLPVKKTVKRK